MLIINGKTPSSVQNGTHELTIALITNQQEDIEAYANVDKSIAESCRSNQI